MICPLPFPSDPDFVRDARSITMTILSLTCNASGCKRNWDVFQHVGTILPYDLIMQFKTYIIYTLNFFSSFLQRRNRLAQSHLNDLVFVKFDRPLR